MATFPDPRAISVGFAFGHTQYEDPSGLTYEVVSPADDPDTGTDPGPVLDGFTITGGRVGDASETSPTDFTVVLRNDDGRFSPRNVSSPYWPNLRQGVPVRIAVDVGSGPEPLATAFALSWDVISQGPGIDEKVRVQCLGLLNRLSRDRTTFSALRCTLGASSPVAFWPLESEGPDATILSSALNGGLAATVPTGLTPGGASGPAGSAGAANIGVLAGNTYDSLGPLILPVGSYTDTGTILVTAHVRQDEPTGATTWFTTLQIMLNGTIGRFAISWTHAGIIVVPTDSEGFGSGPDVIDVLTPGLIEDGDWHELQLLASQNGANVDVDLYLDGELLGSGSLAGTLGAVTSVGRFAGEIDSQPTVTVDLCHVAVHTSAVGDFTDAMGAYAGEQAHERIARVCAERGIPYTSDATESQAMGPQPIATALAILRDGENVDHGVLHELPDGRLTYQSTAERYNLTALTLDYGTETNPGDVSDLVSIDDDRDTYNQITVVGPDGTTVYVEETEGRIGSDTTTGIGPRPVTVNLNVAGPDQLADQAGWILRADTPLPLKAGPGVHVWKIGGPFTRQQVAVHEAAHGVLGVLLGFEVGGCQITSDGGGTLINGDGDPWADAMVALAGAAAVPGSLSEADLGRALKHIAAAEVDRCTAAARDVLSGRIGALRAVAEELHRDGHVHGQRIVELLG